MTSIAAYAQAVRDALAGHPDREELLEDLDDHLTEIAAESDVPLEERLGPPAAYAEELAAAYGGRPAGRQRRRLDLRRRLGDLHATLLRQAPYRALVGFLPDLRPGWWLLRGYVVALLVLNLAGGGHDHIAPVNPGEWVVVVAIVCASVWFGRRARDRAARLLAVAVNVVAGLGLFGGFVTAGHLAGYQEELQSIRADPRVIMETASGVDGEVYNIKPYAKDGTPLTDVYLYDQDGNPVVTHPENYGYSVDRSCGEVILNRYPLPLVADEGTTGESGVTRAAPCPSVSPASPMPSVPPTRPETTADVTATPTPAEENPADETPTDDPTGKPAATPTPKRSH
ncbi:hypothetical protein [Nonomuraea rhodomycinica]|uniref:Proline-rich protein n=1 Tax=Nonomuraea rhodomycinica TaxID=1712872 RepID=A0A7Y6MCL0_9ACTN|nr:hypothetical protein [Nonomuraea rhodomycinica]NUW43503.1 hypothetical protein [Nonomuraea rhodomycinica]